MSAYALFKQALAVWTKVPGLPFTVTNPITQPERLPGMTDWAPREVITRMGQGMQQGVNLDELVEREKSQGLGRSLAMGSAGGVIGGGALGRLMSGEAATAPAREILQKGVSLRGLKGLARTPGAMKALTLGGLGLGAVGSSIGWGMGREDRGQMAQSVARGLRRENLVQQNANLQNRVMRGQLSALSANPMPSATAGQPLVVQSGKAS